MKKSFWYPSIVGFMIYFIALGLCRFAYTPLIPAMVNHHWVSLGGAGYLGASNFFGYVLGSFFAYRISLYVQPARLLQLMLVLSVIALALCSWDLSFTWLLFWRFVAGITGGLFMVLTPTALLQFVPEDNHKASIGFMFSGVGIGVVFASLLAAPISAHSVFWAWMTMAIITLLLTFACWPLVSKSKRVEKEVSSEGKPCTKLSCSVKWALAFLAIGYFLIGPGGVPTLLFGADYAHRVLHASIAISGVLFAWFGLGIFLGSLLAGYLAKKIGTYASLIICNVCGLVSVLLILWTSSLFVLGLSAAMMGFYVVAVAALVSLRIFDFVPRHEHPRYFGWFALSFALGQFVFSYLYSYMLQLGMKYMHLFDVAALALVVAVITMVLARTKKSRA